MIISDIPWWTKLWWKGVDISSTVIASGLSALIVATVATITWRRKRKRDLEFEAEKQRQSLRIAREEANSVEADFRKACLDRWKKQREALALRAEKTIHRRIATEIVEDYATWLRSTSLVSFGDNRVTIEKWLVPESVADGPPQMFVRLEREQLQLLAADIRSTSLPDCTDDSFAWHSR